MMLRRSRLRAALAVLALAYALALSGFLGARMQGAHAAQALQLGGVQAICAEHGRMTLPPGPGGSGHEHPECPCGPGCPSAAFQAPALVATDLAWSPASDEGPAYRDLSVLPLGSRAPPDITARGPPVLA